MDQVRLGVQSAAQPRLTRDRVEHRGHRAFALGAGDMHRAEPPIRSPISASAWVHPFELVDLPLAPPANKVSPAFSKAVA